jgi:hypothetical protein
MLIVACLKADNPFKSVAPATASSCCLVSIGATVKPFLSNFPNVMSYLQIVHQEAVKYPPVARNNVYRFATSILVLPSGNRVTGEVTVLLRACLFTPYEMYLV